MDFKEHQEEIIETMIDDRKKFEPGSKDLVQHDKNIVEAFKAYQSTVKLESDIQLEQQKMEHEKDMQKSDIEQKNAEVKKKTMAEYAKTGAGVLATIAGFGLALLSRKDEREGFITDNQTNLFERFRKMKP